MDPDAVFERHAVQRFNGSNFQNWKFRLETYLDQQDLLCFIKQPVKSMVEFSENDSSAQRQRKKEELSKLVRRDKKCIDVIVQRVADTHLEYVRDKPTAFEAFASLAETFEKRGRVSRIMMKRKLFQMKFVRGSCSMEEHMLNFEVAVRDLKAAGAKMDDEDILTSFLITLPEDFENLINISDSLEETLTFSYVKSRVLECERRRSEQTSSNSDVFGTAFRADWNAGRNKFKKSAKFQNVSGNQNSFRSTNSRNFETI